MEELLSEEKKLKNKSGGEERENLEELARDLDRFLFFKQIRAFLRPYRQLLLILVSLLFVLLAYLGWYYYQRRELSGEEFTHFAQSLVAQSEKEYDYKWTIDKLQKIQADETGTSGTKLADILKIYGKPSDVEVDEKEEVFYITYQKYAFDDNAFSSVEREEGDTYQDVSLGLKRFDGVYRVVYFSGRFVAKDYPSRKGENSQLLGKATELASLKVGDSSSGIGGLSADLVVGTFGRPTYSAIYINANEPETLFLVYDLPNSALSYWLSFRKQKSGEYLLYHIMIPQENRD